MPLDSTHLGQSDRGQLTSWMPCIRCSRTCSTFSSLSIRVTRWSSLVCNLPTSHSIISIRTLSSSIKQINLDIIQTKGFLHTSSSHPDTRIKQDVTGSLLRAWLTNIGPLLYFMELPGLRPPTTKLTNFVPPARMPLLTSTTDEISIITFALEARFKAQETAYQAPSVIRLRPSRIRLPIPQDCMCLPQTLKWACPLPRHLISVVT